MSASPVPSSIVVADACPWSRKRIREILNAAGHRTVLEAADGAQVVGLLEGALPSLLVLDWSLPVVGTPELMQLARDAQGGGAPDLPIIVTMTDPKAGEVRRAMDAGVTNIVAKPFSPRLMRRRLQDAQASPAT
jgi:two-component system chemotaxis response regulator CheY